MTKPNIGTDSTERVSTVGFGLWRDILSDIYRKIEYDVYEATQAESDLYEDESDTEVGVASWEAVSTSVL